MCAKIQDYNQYQQLIFVLSNVKSKFKANETDFEQNKLLFVC